LKLLDPKKSFENVDTMDRMKAYLRDVPVLHARMVKVIEEQEALLSNQQAHLNAARASLTRFEALTKQIEDTVAKWEKEQADAGRDAGPAPAAAAPAVAPSGTGAVTGG
jgi:septal ring factor EnvC (AmiA/AmiB activator)